jgi:hypothetical protein
MDQDSLRNCNAVLAPGKENRKTQLKKKALSHSRFLDLLCLTGQTRRALAACGGKQAQKQFKKILTRAALSYMTCPYPPDAVGGDALQDARLTRNHASLHAARPPRKSPLLARRHTVSSSNGGTPTW